MSAHSYPGRKMAREVYSNEQDAAARLKPGAPATMTDDFGHECTEVRVLPMSSDPHGGNILCGHRGYCREIAFRIERNKEVAYPFALPAWETLKVYFPEGGK